MGFYNGFSSRFGGVSPYPEHSLNLAGFDDDTSENINENRRRFLEFFPGGMKLATVWQTHSSDLQIIKSGSELNSSQKADAIISDMKGILAGIKTADCVPVLIGDPVTEAYAAVHSGWRGTAANISVKAIQALEREFSCDPTNLIAAIGPSATLRNYEVGPEVIQEISKVFPEVEKFTLKSKADRSLINLPAIISQTLIAAGLQKENIFICPYCTIADNHLFFSYRADRKRWGKSGRMLSVIGRK
ncbi:MAG TPA: peptidoglycan editing factor PgeF [Pyrinomonadaceae bacterium]|nr:peptidoglycan editing factor PgeF [Pyrinomonadaceae bacterium]